MTFYVENYDRRMGGEFIEVYNENGERIDTIKTKKDIEGNVVYRETELPIDPEWIKAYKEGSTDAVIFGGRSVAPGLVAECEVNNEEIKVAMDSLVKNQQ